MLNKQAKVLLPAQIKAVLHYLGQTRNPIRNKAIFLLSVKAGLRAKEIANLKWDMLLEADGALGQVIQLENIATKRNSGRMIPINKQLHAQLARLLNMEKKSEHFHIANSYVIHTERSCKTSAQAIVNMFSKWYSELGFVGCSSHSGRRTFITNAARKISLVGGSLRDVQALAGHSTLTVTQKYIELDNEARRRVVDLV